MPVFRVSNEVGNDILGIGRYTQKKWGAAQRRSYLSGLDRKFSEIARNPKLAAERIEFEPPVRIQHYEKHLIVYVIDDVGAFIIRVLHESMDVSAHISRRQ